MTYDNIVTGTFFKRPNRFIAYVEVRGDVKTCHVKNTGRCQELLVPGCRVVLEFHPKAKEMKRKTEYDLIAVYKGDLLINMDSQAPNQAALEWMREKEAKGLLWKMLEFQQMFGEKLPTGIPGLTLLLN